MVPPLVLSIFQNIAAPDEAELTSSRGTRVRGVPYEYVVRVRNLQAELSCSGDSRGGTQNPKP
eukprot:SAG22_NODE_9631_length_578_cov_1.212944_1_plen_63_part_00